MVQASQINIGFRVRNVINELTSDSLLDKCLRRKTLNQNESFNNIVWELFYL